MVRASALQDSQQRLSAAHGTSRQIKTISLGLLQWRFLARHADMWLIEKHQLLQCKIILLASWVCKSGCWCHMEPPQRLAAAHGTSRGAPLEHQERVSAVHGIPRHVDQSVSS